MEISAVVIAKNEEKKIADCLESLSWATEIVFVDTGSTDRTIEIAKKHKVNLIKTKGGSYDTWRTVGLKHAKCPWVFYLDADERVTPELRAEIVQKISQDSFSYYVIPRKNIILGKVMIHGGWFPDYVKRLYFKDSLKGWKGALHEEPVVEGRMGFLRNPMIHLKHDNLSEMVIKTNKWSGIEADSLIEAKHPRMVWWRFLRIMITELWYRLIKLRGLFDDSEGVIYAFYQSWSRFITYAKLWEKQLDNAEQN